MPSSSLPSTSALTTTSPSSIVVATRDPSIGRLVAMALRLDGYAPQVYVDGEHALEALLTAPYAAAVLDARLPKIDGPTLCQRVRATPPVASVPIILLVMRDEPARQARGRRLGATAFLYLPFTIEE